jgi:hypothetical protein
MEGTSKYVEWQWVSVDFLYPGMARGSLCCELAIKTKGRVS